MRKVRKKRKKFFFLLADVYEIHHISDIYKSRLEKHEVCLHKIIRVWDM